MNLMEILNSPLLYALVIGGIAIVSCICVFFFVRGRKRLLELGMEKGEFNSAMRASAIFSIVPSIAVIIGLFSLAPLLGTPWPWFRLSVVGSLQYELMAADLAAKGVGYDTLAAYSAANDASTLGVVMFVMSISIMAGMVCNLFLTKKICKTANTFTAKGGAWGALAISCFLTAMMCTFLPAQMVGGIIPLLTVAVSALVTILLAALAKKRSIKWLPDFIMSFALIIGMISSVIFSGLLG